MPKKKEHYLTNKDFLSELRLYKISGIISDKLGSYFIHLATKVSSKGGFCGYTWKEDMISDALENCCRYVHKFDPEISQNPFGYFTQVVVNSFVAKIKDEHKHMYTRYKIIEESNIMENKEFDPSYYKGEFIDKFEKGLRDKKIKQKKKNGYTYDNFLDIEIEDE